MTVRIVWCLACTLSIASAGIIRAGQTERLLSAVEVRIPVGRTSLYSRDIGKGQPELDQFQDLVASSTTTSVAVACR